MRTRGVQKMKALRLLWLRRGRRSWKSWQRLIAWRDSWWILFMGLIVDWMLPVRLELRLWSLLLSLKPETPILLPLRPWLCSMANGFLRKLFFFFIYIKLGSVVCVLLNISNDILLCSILVWAQLPTPRFNHLIMIQKLIESIQVSTIGLVLRPTIMVFQVSTFTFLARSVFHACCSPELCSLQCRLYCFSLINDNLPWTSSWCSLKN